MLEVENLQVAYGSIVALQGLSLRVAKGSIVTLIGANGAGKTTTLRAVSGLLKATSGSITFDGENITNRAPHKIVGMACHKSRKGAWCLRTLR